MDEIVSFLRAQGAPAWAIASLVVGALAWKPTTWFLAYLRRPTMEAAMNDRFTEMGRQQAAFFAQLAQQAKDAAEEARQARGEAAQARTEAREARVATVICEAKHDECRETVAQLETRVVELERVGGLAP